MEAIKDIEIGSHTYMIAKMDADSGSWLLMRLMGQLQKAISEMPSSAEVTEQATEETQDTAQAAIQFLLMNLDQDTFKTVQRHALNVCYRYETVGNAPKPLPVIMTNGRFCYKDLNFDIQSVMRLTSESLFANLSPFFSKDGLKAMLTGERDSSQLSFPT